MATILNPTFALVMGNIDHWTQGLSANWASAAGAVGVEGNYTAPASFGDNFVFQTGVFTDFALGTTYTVNVTVRNVMGMTGTADIYFGNVSIGDIVGTVSALSPGLHTFTGTASSDVLAIASTSADIVIESCEIPSPPVPTETVIVPQNSFVQSAPEDFIRCVPEVSLCLPVLEAQDVWFQFIHITGGAGYDYLISIIKDGDVFGTPIALTSIEIDDGVYSPDPVNLVIMTGLGGAGFEDLADGDCFCLRVTASTASGPYETIFDSICFHKIIDPCWTSAISYSSTENAFGFYYYHITDMMNDLDGYFNKIRLPFYLTTPQFPEKDNVFLKSDGTRKLLSSRIDQEWLAKTDYMPRQWHEKLIVARSHDLFRVDNINTEIIGPAQYVKNGAYEINWLEYLDHPVSQAKFKLLATPYYNVNSNCR